MDNKQTSSLSLGTIIWVCLIIGKFAGLVTMHWALVITSIIWLPIVAFVLLIAAIFVFAFLAVIVSAILS